MGRKRKKKREIEREHRNLEKEKMKKATYEELMQGMGRLIHIQRLQDAQIKLLFSAYIQMVDRMAQFYPQEFEQMKEAIEIPTGMSFEDLLMHSQNNLKAQKEMQKAQEKIAKGQQQSVSEDSSPEQSSQTS